MDRRYTKGMKMKPKNLNILFVGNPHRGKQFQEAVKPNGWKISIKTETEPTRDKSASVRPDLVILDDFPESKAARSFYHELCMNQAGPFLALNESPSALKFLHVNALSFIKFIHRDPEPKELINAISRLMRPK